MSWKGSKMSKTACYTALFSGTFFFILAVFALLFQDRLKLSTEFIAFLAIALTVMLTVGFTCAVGFWEGVKVKAKSAVDYAAKQLKPHVSYTLYLASGKCRSLMIPRERAPLDYLETWYRFNPGEVVVKMRNNETGEEMEV